MSQDTLININNVKKTYADGLEALKGVNLEIKRGEILALLGPNGAGKTTLINAICGIVIPTSGYITVDGFDVVKNFRETRSQIGLVPQELNLEAFEKVFQNVSFTRGLYGKKENKRKLGIISFNGNWHGRTMGAQMMSGNKKQKEWIGYEDKNIHHIDFPYPWELESISPKNFLHNSLKKLKKKIDLKKGIKKGSFYIDKKMDFHGRSLLESEDLFNDYWNLWDIKLVPWDRTWYKFQLLVSLNCFMDNN